MYPDVSVLMTVYNGAPYVARSIGSVLEQTYPNFEFIIVDDGSKDETWEILTSLAERDKRISLLRNEENLGIPKSANRGLAIVKGRFLARQDADDWSYPARLEKQLDYLRAHKDCVALGTRMLVVDGADRPIRLYDVRTTHEEIDAFHMNGFGGMLAHPSMVARTKIVRETGGYREEFPLAEDYDLFLRLAEVGRLHNLPDVLVRYNMHSGNISRTKKELMKFHKNAALKDAWERRGLCFPGFDRFPDSRMKRSKGSRALALIRFGTKNVLRHPGSLEGWSALKAGFLRLFGKRMRKAKEKP
ncbi:MAG: glycosyltransferase [Thermovirgaceae bacterium]|nr:glycosyltransferase [Thermovirgaceae bacterium]